MAPDETPEERRARYSEMGKKSVEARRRRKAEREAYRAANPAGALGAVVGEGDFRKMLGEIAADLKQPGTVRVQALSKLLGVDEEDGSLNEVALRLLMRSLSPDQLSVVAGAECATLADVVDVLVAHALDIHLPGDPEPASPQA